ncbi:MAG: DNA primase [Candidatus Velthaea sp.]
MRFDDGIKREVLARTDIAEFIGQFVTLRKRGNDLVGLCPFHAEKTPSFHVHPDRGFFKCFGCGAGGDVINFLRTQDNLTFPDALRVLAKRAGLELAEENPAAARVRSEKEAIFHANDVAASFFHRTLVLDGAGERARAYCARRGIIPETIAAFKLGYAPAGWNGLADELRANGVDLALAVKAGLAKPGQHGYYDFYRDRLMIPTYASTGETIAFGGRALGDDEPKYLNTSTTPVYTKGRYLYALNVARRAAGKEDAAIVVEGYLDCIALHQAGFGNTVAALGTAFTPEQARELRKVTANVFVCFDADAAGLAATAKSIDVLVEAGCSARIVALPPGEDPDGYVRTHGAPAFRAALDAALPWMQFKLDREIDAIRTGFTSAAEIARRAEALLGNVPREEWDRWRVYVAGRLGLSADDLRKSRLVNPVHFAPRPGGQSGGSRASRHIVPGAVEAPTFEREVLGIFLDEPALIAEFADRIPPERFGHALLRRIYARLVERREALVQPTDVYALFAEDGAESAALTTIAGGERSATVRFADDNARRAYLVRVVERFAADDLQRRYMELGARIDGFFESGAAVPAELREEHAALGKKLKG